MSLLQRALRWLLREIAAADPDSLHREREAMTVLLLTKNGTSIEGLLVGRGDTYVFAPGALTMVNGSRSWHPQGDHVYVPAHAVDHWVKIPAERLSRDNARRLNA